MKFRLSNFDNIIVLRIFFLAVIFIYLPHFVESFNIFKDYPYVFNLGHGVLPETKPEIVEYLIKIIRERD